MTTPIPYPDVVSVACRPNYTLAIQFANGERGIFDMKPHLGLGVFRQLRTPELFQTARVAWGSVMWDQEIDIHPERIYRECVMEKSGKTNLGSPQEITA